MTVVSLETVRRIKDTDPSCWTLESGTHWFKYAVDYTDRAGDVFSFTIWATGDEDAAERVAAIRASAQLLVGSVCAEIGP